MGSCVASGAVVIPSGHDFPGTAVDNNSPAGKKPIFFATAGENGVVKIWSSATAQCVYEHKGHSHTTGGNYVHLALLPGNAGLMVASADCNLLFLQPKVCGDAANLSAGCDSHGMNSSQSSNNLLICCLLMQHHL